MIYNKVMSSEVVKGHHLDDLIKAINNNEVFGDQTTIIVNKSDGGTSLQVADQYGGGTSGGTVSGVSAFQIQSGGNGVYTAKKIDQTTGEPLADDFTIIATRATAYDLPATSYVVGFDVTVTTLGG